MTDKDLKELCQNLRNPWRSMSADVTDKAADEIERLIKERDTWVRDGEIAWQKVLALSRCITTPQSQR